MYDDFDTPKDDHDDWAVPKEATQARPKKVGAPKRLVNAFYEQWSISRCQNTSFGLAFSNQGAITATFKRLLTEHSEDELLAMIKVFFDQAVAGRMYLSGNEMWRDFLSNKAQVWQIVQSSGTVSAPMEDMTEHNRQVEALRQERLAERDAQRARVAP